MGSVLNTTVGSLEEKIVLEMQAQSKKIEFALCLQTVEACVQSLKILCPSSSSHVILYKNAAFSKDEHHTPAEI